MKLTARQLTAELAYIDGQLDCLRMIEENFEIAFGAETVPEAIGTAWNATHDAIREMEAHRAKVAENRAPLTAAQAASMALITANVD